MRESLREREHLLHPFVSLLLCFLTEILRVAQLFVFRRTSLRVGTVLETGST